MAFDRRDRRSGWWMAGCLMALAGTAFGQQADPLAGDPIQQQPAADPAGSSVLVRKPVLTVAAAETNLGNILDVEKTVFTVEFTNTGDGVLVISRVQPSCGCTAAKPNKTEYMPGEKGTIEGEFDPRGKEGPVSKTITIFTNDSENPSTVVTFKSVVEPLVKIEPKILNFGKVDKTLGKSMFVTLTSAAPGFEATLATSSDDRFSASVVKTEDVTVNGKASKRATVEVKMNKGAKVGRGTSTIAIRTNQPKADLLNVQIVAEITGELEVTPTPASFGNLPGGQPFEAKVTLKSKSGKPVKVKGVELRRPNNLGLETSLESNENNTIHTVTIKGTAPQRTGAMLGELAVLTEEPGEEEIKIPFYAFIRVAGAQTPAVVPGSAGGQPQSQPVSNPTSVKPATPIRPGALTPAPAPAAPSATPK